VHRPLPVGAISRLSLGWWGVLTVIATEGALLAYLLFSYFYVTLQTYGSMAPPMKPPLHFALPMTGVLILNIGAMWWASHSSERNSRGALMGAVGAGLLLGLAFIALEFVEWFTKSFTPRASAYASAYFVLTGVHLAHVVVGAIMLILLMIWSALGYFDSRRNAPVVIISAYWYMVDAVWIVYFFSAYAAPYFQ
jgi:cytochrome c oxidase subunit 3